VLVARSGRGAIEFRPEPEGLGERLAGLATGSVLRLAIQFREPPWGAIEDLPKGRSLDRMSFLHTRGSVFNVFWSAYPMRVPLAVGWCGGPPAAELSRLGPARIREVAITTLARHLGLSRARIASKIERTWYRDWNRDPFSRGAYTYAVIGGANAAEALARPVQGTLFFAGEHTIANSGTVEGAISSGFRAAKQVERALGRG
jgi:monoamine oxidase